MYSYNMTRENVKKGMEILVQAKVPISRPDDFFAEMLKSDLHMAKVKSKLLQQQVKIQNFEERKQRLENKKFHKAIKAYKQSEKHKEKRENVENINKFKQQVKEKGGDADEKEFNKLFNGGVLQQNKKGQKKRVIDALREKHHQKQNQQQQKGRKGKQIKKQQGKRPGKVARNKHKQRNKKR